MAHKVTNPTDRPVYATLSHGPSYEVLPGASIDVENPRDAMLLGEYGLNVQRVDVDEALLKLAVEDPRVEVPFTPAAHHGPGTDSFGALVDAGAQEAFASAHDGDLLPSASASSGAVPAAGPTGETVSSSGKGGKAKAAPSAPPA